MARRFPVTEGMLPIVVIARTAHGGMRGDHPIRECSQGSDNLEHRARRILALRSPVVQRKVRIGAQGPPRSGRGTGDKGVRIKGRLARQSENLAITRVEGHDGAVVIFEEALGELLELEIKGQHEIHTGRRWTRRDDLCFTPNSIDLYLAEPWLTAEYVFKGLFKPRLSNQIARIVAEVLALLELHLANFPEVAQQVRGQRAVGIGP